MYGCNERFLYTLPVYVWRDFDLIFLKPDGGMVDAIGEKRAVYFLKPIVPKEGGAGVHRISIIFETERPDHVLC